MRSVDFSKGSKRFEANIAAGSEGGTIEVRLDSLTATLIGTCHVRNTGSIQQWENQSWPVKKMKGIHDVYFIFKGGEGNLFNFNRWKFKAK